MERGLAKYPDPVGNSFRRRAAEVLGVEPEWILCGNGSDDILTILTRAYVGEGDLLRMPYPSNILYRTLAEIQGASYEEVLVLSVTDVDEPATAADGSITIDEDTSHIFQSSDFSLNDPEGASLT